MRLFHSAFHITDQFGKLPALFILFLKARHQVLILTLELGNNSISLPELFLYYFELARVSESILRLHHVLELASQTDTFFTIKLYLNLEFSLPSGPNVSFESFNLVLSELDLVLQIADLSLQIDLKVRFNFDLSFANSCQLRHLWGLEIFLLQ